MKFKELNKEVLEQYVTPEDRAEAAVDFHLALAEFNKKLAKLQEWESTERNVLGDYEYCLNVEDAIKDLSISLGALSAARVDFLKIQNKE